MLFKLPVTPKRTLGREATKSQDALYPIYYVLMGLIFGGVLLLSAVNNFLFFGWLAISMSIIFGLLTIHLVGNSQTEKTKS